MIIWPTPPLETTWSVQDPTAPPTPENFNFFSFFSGFHDFFTKIFNIFLIRHKICSAKYLCSCGPCDHVVISGTLSLPLAVNHGRFVNPPPIADH